MKLKSVLIRMPEEQHKKLKIKAATDQTTINDLVLNAINKTY